MLNSVRFSRRRSPLGGVFSVLGMRTIEWDAARQQVRMIDQRLLPGVLRVASYADYRQVAAAIREMVVRGAPAIGAAAAFGLALAARALAAGGGGGLGAGPTAA